MGSRRFMMRQKMFSIGDDSWVEDDPVDPVDPVDA